MSEQSPTRPIPNLFLVGAPKSGTTALATYLGEHPDVFMASNELHYFGSDLDFRWRITLEGYLQWFTTQGTKRYRGEKSVYYLCSKLAASEIRAFSPDASIIIMLRNPVDQMYSSHSELLFQGDEDIRDFEQALAAEELRRRGERLPPGCRKPFALQYRAIAHYPDQVGRYLAEFGARRVLTIVYEDFAEDPAGSYRTALEFLGLDPAFAPGFRAVNPNKVVRSAGLRDLVRGKSAMGRRIGRMLLPSARARQAVARRVQALNTVERRRPALSPSLRSALQQEFTEDIARLEDLLERDLSRWRSDRAPAH